MRNKTFDQLPSAAPLSGAEVLALVQSQGGSPVAVGASVARVAAYAVTAVVTQLDWYIAATSGSDAATGMVGAPLKTWAELRRRWGARPNLLAPVDQPFITVHLVTAFIRCRLYGVICAVSHQPYFANCCITAGISAQGCSMTVSGGLVGDVVVADWNSFILVDNDVLVSRILVVDGGKAILGAVGIFDSSGGTAISVDASGGHVLVAPFFGASALYGDGHTVGVELAACATMAIDPSAVVALAGDFTLGGATTARAWDEAAGAYTDPVACTWENLAKPIADGGLGGNAHNVAKRASIATV